MRKAPVSAGRKMGVWDNTRRMFKQAIQGRSERVIEGVPRSEKTKLVACFNILLRFDDDIDKGGQTLSAFTVGHAKLEPVKSLFRYGGGNERGLGHIRI